MKIIFLILVNGFNDNCLEGKGRNDMKDIGIWGHM
jgi:hypothetical protein